ncbi:shikimate dehydrogenase [Pseudoclavibacter chungangensis]|nr:shikimate dehydrogenase [Pseudoclavibacter chungangensis]
MPLKSAVIPRCATVSETAELAGAVNTLVFDDGGPRAAAHGHNTDVDGFRSALREVGAVPSRVDLLGAGNTAASAVVAVAGLGARRLRVLARRPERARPLADLARRLGLDVEVVELSSFVADDEVDLVVDTIPDGRHVHVRYPADVRARATLFEAVYDPWPPAMAALWLDVGGRVVTGLDLLVHQAVGQVRLFVRPEDEAVALPDATLVGIMRAALGVSSGH